MYIKLLSGFYMTSPPPVPLKETFLSCLVCTSVGLYFRIKDDLYKWVCFISELSQDKTTMEDKSFEEGKVKMLLHRASFNMHATVSGDNNDDDDDNNNGGRNKSQRTNPK